MKPRYPAAVFHRLREYPRRACSVCGSVILPRLHINKGAPELEPLERFMARDTCSNACRQAARDQRAPIEWAAVDWRETDSELARELNVTREAVRQQRKRRGLPASNGRHAAKVQAARRIQALKRYADGEAIDVQDAAQHLSVSPTTIRSYARQARIPIRRRDPGPAPKYDWANVDWTRNDTAIARDLGCAQAAVHRKRRKLGMPKVDGRKNANRPDKPRTGVWRETLAALEAAGSLTTREAAALFGESSATASARLKYLLSTGRATAERIRMNRGRGYRLRYFPANAPAPKPAPKPQAPAKPRKLPTPEGANRPTEPYAAPTKPEPSRAPTRKRRTTTDTESLFVRVFRYVDGRKGTDLTAEQIAKDFHQPTYAISAILEELASANRVRRKPPLGPHPARYRSARP